MPYNQSVKEAKLDNATSEEVKRLAENLKLIGGDRCKNIDFRNKSKFEPKYLTKVLADEKLGTALAKLLIRFMPENSKKITSVWEEDITKESIKYETVTYEVRMEDEDYGFSIGNFDYGVYLHIWKWKKEKQ